jgi:serine/threonine protein kinase
MRDDEKYLIKLILIKKDIKFNDLDILNEIEILKTIDHPKIVKIFEFFITEKAYFLITDLVTEGELFNEIADNHKEQPYKEEAAAIITHPLVFKENRNLINRNFSRIIFIK